MASGGSANDSFVFIGTAAFTAEGQVRVEQGSGGCFVEGNMAGAGPEDMKIWLDNVTASSVTAGDFVL